jgi:N-acyl homoserine lactone hydrolase
VLFDTGQDRASVTDPGYFPGGMTGALYGRLARFEISPDETLSAGLGRLGYAAGDVTTAVISHLHQDTSAASPSSAPRTSSSARPSGTRCPARCRRCAG